MHRAASVVISFFMVFISGSGHDTCRGCGA
jgi:hypothetical protein